MSTASKRALGLIIFLVVAGLVVFVIHGSNKTTAPSIKPSSPSQSNSVEVTSTSPSPLNGSTITPTQTISITFSEAVLNKDEFRSSIDPKIDYTVRLSDDRKTVKITPATPYGFNQQYTLHISRETKFEGGKKLDSDKDIHYGTVSYQGV